MASLDSNFDGTDAVLMRNSWHYFVQITWSNIQHGVTSHYPSVSREPQPRAFSGWRLGWVVP